MKNIVLSFMALSACAVVGAQEFGRVVSSTPVIGQVAVPQQVCQDSSVVVPGHRDGTGAAIGAATGAVIGSAIGHGGDRAVAAVIGMIGGAILGDHMSGRHADQIQRVRHCSTQTTFENRVLHYNVEYEYAGRRHVVQMPHDPGPTLQVQVTPVGIAPPAYAAPPPMASIAPMQAAPTITTIHTTTEYVPYLAPVRIAPIVIGLPMPGWHHAPPHLHHPHRAVRPHVRQHPHRATHGYPRHPSHGQPLHWR